MTEIVILAGLVAITPAAGSVAPWGALALGIGSSTVCYFALQMKPKLGRWVLGFVFLHY